MASDNPGYRPLVEEVGTARLRTQENLPNRIGKVGLNPDPVRLKFCPAGDNPFRLELLQAPINAGQPMRRCIEVDVFRLKQSSIKSMNGFADKVCVSLH